MAQKYYAVRKGHVPGIYGNCEDYTKQITGYSYPESRVFKTYAEARKYMDETPPKPKPEPKPPTKYYAVKKGWKIGIFTTQQQYDAATKGYKGAKARSFKDLQKARAYMEDIDKNMYVSEQITRPDLEGLKAAIAYVDGSYNPTTNRCAYGVVILCDSREIHIKGIVRDIYDKQSGTAETYAAIAAMMYCASHGISKLWLHYDCAAISSYASKGGDSLGDMYRNFMSRLKCIVDVEFIKVKAHSGIPLNEYADELAKEACGYDCWQ